MAFYRKKPVVIEARQFTQESGGDLLDWASENRIKATLRWDGQEKALELIIHTLEGDMTASDGDYIIKGVQGEFYPCKPDIFWATYELADIQPDQLVAQQDDRLARWKQEQIDHDRG